MVVDGGEGDVLFLLLVFIAEALLLADQDLLLKEKVFPLSLLGQVMDLEEQLERLVQQLLLTPL